MSTKSLGGVLTPIQGFVCLRCCLGNGTVNLERTRRYRQTHARSRVIDTISALPSEISRHPHDPLKSNPGASAKDRHPSSILGNRAYTRTSEKIQSDSESLARLEQRYSELRRQLRGNLPQFSQLEEGQNGKAVRLAKAKVGDIKVTTSTKQNKRGEQESRNEAFKVGEKRRGVQDTIKRMRAAKTGSNNAVETEAMRDNVINTPERKRATRKVFNQAVEADQKKGGAKDTTERIRAAQIGSNTAVKVDEKGGNVIDTTERKRATKNVSKQAVEANEKKGSAKDTAKRMRAVKIGSDNAVKADDKRDNVIDTTERKRVMKKDYNQAVDSDQNKDTAKYTTESMRAPKTGSNNAAKADDSTLPGSRTAERVPDKPARAVNKVSGAPTIRTVWASKDNIVRTLFSSVNRIVKITRSEKKTAGMVGKERSGVKNARILRERRSEKKTAGIVRKERSGVKNARILRERRSEKKTAGIVRKERIGVKNARILREAGSTLRTAGIVRIIRSEKRTARILKEAGSTLKNAGIVRIIRSEKRTAGIVREERSGVKNARILRERRSGKRTADIVREESSGVKDAPIVREVRVTDGLTNDKSARAKMLKVRPALGLLRKYMPTQRGREIQCLKAKELTISAIENPGLSVPSLSYGLERVLFNPGVYHLQDPRSRVFNFDPYLQTIMPVEDFNFSALKGFTTSSKDKNLKRLAEAHDKRYVGSSSSMTGVLCHFHYLLSQWRQIDAGMLSRDFPGAAVHTSFTGMSKSPSAIFLRWREGTYAIDADKEFNKSNILSSLGQPMEKLLTSNTKDFERYRKSNPDPVSLKETNNGQDYHYATIGDLLLRSQLDAYDARLPGTGMFDLKTRSVVSIRMDVSNYKLGVGYQIKSPRGEWESYEREYFDMIRSAFLKYSLQVRMGRMDGIFVAYHNIERMFGFQYIPLPELDKSLHGTYDTTIGDQEFKMSLHLFNQILNIATKKYPERSLRIHFETRETISPFMYVFAEPMSEAQVQEIQSKNAADIEEFERSVLGLKSEAPSEENEQVNETKRADIEASVQEVTNQDEMSPLVTNTDQESSFVVAKDTSSGPSHERSYIGGPLYRKNTNEEQDNENFTASSSVGDGQVDIGDGRGCDDETRVDDEQKDVEEASNEVDGDEAGVDADLESQEDDIGRKGNGELSETGTGGEHGALSTAVGLDNMGHDQVITSNEESQQTLADDDTSSPSPELSDFDCREVSEQTHIIGAEAAGARNDSLDVYHEVLAMKLRVRNKVNGQYVLRPLELSSADDWTVEYSLAEIQDAQRAWYLYQSCKLRRQKMLDTARSENSQTLNHAHFLREKSREGAIWRRAMDKEDEARPRVVL